jgi:hypothetical protein
MAEPAGDARLRAAVFRFLVAAGLLAGAATAFQGALVAAVLPLFRAWLDGLDDTFRTVDLSLVAYNGELFVVRVATTAHAHVVGSAVVYPDPHRLVPMPVAAGIVLQPPVLAVALLVGLPWGRWRELAWRLALGLPLIALVVLLDVPLMLYGFTWNEEVSVLEPQRFSPLIFWADAMNAGGRFALAIAAVAVSAAAAARLSAPVPPGAAATGSPAAPPAR